MIDFKEVKLEDLSWAEQILFESGLRGCDNTFVVMYTWQKAYGIRIARLEDFVLGQMCSDHGTAYYYPLGKGNVKSAIDALRMDAAEREIPFQLVCVTPEMICELEQLYPGKFVYEPFRDAFDYVYEIDKLVDLAGKKLHAKRNHINRFVENNPDWSVVTVTAEWTQLCLQIENLWKAKAAETAAPGSNKAMDQKYEDVAIHRAMRDFELLELEGIMILAGVSPVAFALGKRASRESYNIHFEKADATIQGSYAMVNREYARWIRERYPEVRYINREDDMGVPGLRKAKKSYYPDRMIEKYSATWIV